MSLAKLLGDQYVPYGGSYQIRPQDCLLQILDGKALRLISQEDGPVQRLTVVEQRDGHHRSVPGEGVSNAWIVAKT